MRSVTFLGGWSAMIGLVASCVFMAGCAEEPKAEPEGPSYAELVVTYNAELETLDRLEKKKAELEQQLAAVGKPTEQDAMNMLGSLLGPAAQGGDNANSDAPTDPNAALDQAVQQAQATQDAARGMLDALSNQGKTDPQTAQQHEQERAKIKAELEQVEQEIEAQGARVELARQARDAAEAARKNRRGE